MRGYCRATSRTYCTAIFWAGISGRQARRKSSFQPARVSSVPRKDRYKRPSPVSMVSAANCSAFSVSSQLTKQLSFISRNRLDAAIFRSISGMAAGTRTPMSMVSPAGMVSKNASAA